MENLFTWARSQTGDINFAPEQSDLKVIVEEVMNVVKGAAGRKEIRLSNEINLSEFVFADKNMIKTILRNLLSNSIKFTLKKGTISITSKKQNNFIKITVTDTGIGMEKSCIDELFRLDKNTSKPGTEDEKGTGLGLILCKEFVKKNGGDLFIESEVGKGSSFTFTIPRENIFS